MTITENQRRTLDLMAESAGWRWADVETLSAREVGRFGVEAMNTEREPGMPGERMEETNDDN